MGVLAAVIAAGLLPISVVGLEGIHSLLWGRELVAGHGPGFELGQTPRPLLIGMGAVMSVLGTHAGLVGFGLLLGPVALGVLVAATFDIAWQLGSIWAAWLAALLLMTSPVILDWATVARHELAFAALVMVALALEIDRPRRGTPSLALLALAGLLDPKGWLFAVVYALWLGHALRGRRRAVAIGFVLVPPAIWLGLDAAVTGDPLWSLRGDEGRFLSTMRAAGGNLLSAVGPLALLVAGISYPLAMRARLGSMSLLLNALGISLIGFFGLDAALGLDSDPNLPAGICMLTVLAALTASGARFAPSALAASAAFAIVFQSAIRLDSPLEVRDKVGLYQSWIDDARVIADRPAARVALRDCPGAAAPSGTVAALFAYFSGRESERWRVDRAGRTADVFAAPAPGAVSRAFARARMGSPMRFRIPRGLVVTERSRHWRIYARACGRRSLE